MSERTKIQGPIQFLDSAVYIEQDGSGNLAFTDGISGTKTLAELIAAGASYWTQVGSDIFYIAGDVILREDDDGNDAVKLWATDTNGGISIKDGGVTVINLNGNGITYFNGGDVGIGISAPTAKLHLSDSTGLQLRLDAGSATNHWSLGRDQATGNFHIDDDSLGTVFTIDQVTGKMGIGETSPSQRLEIVQLDNTVQGGLAVRDAVTTARIFIWVDSNGIRRIDAASTGGSDLAINGEGTGFVGIGTITPGVALDVIGTVSGTTLKSTGQTNSIFGAPATNNKAKLELNVSNAGSAQIGFSDYGDMSWAIGGDDADNSFKIHGTASSTIPTINGLATPWFEITTAGAVIIQKTLTSALATGTAPFVVASTTKVTNLNADTVDGVSSGSFVRSDTTDSISGALTHTSNYYRFNDNIELYFGTSTSQSTIYSDGTNTRWKLLSGDFFMMDNGTNRLRYYRASGDFYIYLGKIRRAVTETGYLVGSYNVSSTQAATGPIYVMGTSYYPASTTLGNMYGIGYGHGNATFLNSTDLGSTPGSWGMYVAADGNARIFLEGTSGSGRFKGIVYAADHALNSDLRLKENVVPLGGSIDELIPVSYNLISQPGNTQYGFIAQDMLETHSELVMGTGKEDENGSIDYYSIKQNSIIALLVKEVQKLKKENVNLESRLTRIEKLLL